MLLETVMNTFQTILSSPKGTTALSLSPTANKYKTLLGVLGLAYERAAVGKGADRHASGKDFDHQPIMEIQRLLGSVDFPVGQIIKKSTEIKRMSSEDAKKELLDIIVYAASAYAYYEESMLDGKPGSYKVGSGRSWPADYTDSPESMMVKTVMDENLENAYIEHGGLRMADLTSSAVGDVTEDFLEDKETTQALGRPMWT